MAAGGRFGGTLLGLFAIVVLQNGLRLADMPPELAGNLDRRLVAGGDWIRLQTPHCRVRSVARRFMRPENNEEFEVKNSQVAVICGVILLAAGIVACSNFWLVRSIATRARRALVEWSGANVAYRLARSGQQVTVAMMPKSKGNAYFIACRKGAEEAAKELGIELIWDGPTDTDPAKQNEIVETWITRGVDVIAVAVENRDGHFVGAAQGPREGNQGDHVGRGRGAGRARLSRESGHARGDRPTR